MRQVTVVDYGLGNIFSIQQTFQHLGCQVQLAQFPEEIQKAERLILPGVGAFQKGMHHLHANGTVSAIQDFAQTGKMILGICLGMQLLFNEGEENGLCTGLGLIPGRVVRINHPKVPHIGWSKLALNTNHPDGNTLSTTLENRYAYFVHSYHPLPEDNRHLLATTQYHDTVIHAMVKKDNIIGCQFHPEKSGENFLPLLRFLLDCPTFSEAMV